MSHEIHSLAPDQVIKGEFLEEYRRGIDFFHLELTHLNTNLFILDYVLTFPYDLFTEADQSLFFRMVFQNFFYTSLLMITRMTTDTGSDLYTLPKFRNKISQWARDEYRTLLNDRLKKVRLDSNTKKMLDRARGLRSERLAHLAEDIVLGRKEESRVVYGDLKAITEYLNNLLDALSFNVDRMILPIQYASAKDGRISHSMQPDIEIMFDMIARNSRLLNLPETSPADWAMERQYLSEKQIELFNKYRAKYGLNNV